MQRPLDLGDRLALSGVAKRFLAQESLVGHYQAEDHDGYFRNGESNPGLQGENLLS